MPVRFPNRKEIAENVDKKSVSSCTKRQNPHGKRRILWAKRGEEYDRSHLKRINRYDKRNCRVRESAK